MNKKKNKQTIYWKTKIILKTIYHSYTYGSMILTLLYKIFECAIFLYWIADKMRIISDKIYT